jgi:transcriptional antiterminator RfaH
MTETASSAATTWHLLQTKPRQEFRALEQLENQRHICFLPILKVEKMRRGRPEIINEPLFSRYLFIRLDAMSANWSQVRSTRGVSKLVAIGGRFATISDSLVGGLRHVGTLDPAPPFVAGDKVAIASGPFSGLEGVFQISDGAARALVLIELISQPQRLVFDLDMLRKTV